MPAKSNEKWTSEEDERLLELDATGMPTVSIAAELRRTGGAIHSRLSILKARQRLAAAISDPPQSTASQSKRWTLDDDKRLLELKAGGASFEEIAKALKRTRPAIVQRAHVLKPMAD